MRGACCILMCVRLCFYVSLRVCVSNCNYTKLLSIAGCWKFTIIPHTAFLKLPTRIFYIGPALKFPHCSFPSPLCSFPPLSSPFSVRDAVSIASSLSLAICGALINGNLCIMLDPFVAPSKRLATSEHASPLLCPVAIVCTAQVMGRQREMRKLQMENQIKGILFTIKFMNRNKATERENFVRKKILWGRVRGI